MPTFFGGYIWPPRPRTASSWGCPATTFTEFHTNKFLHINPTPNIHYNQTNPNKSIAYLHGELSVIWDKEKVDQMILNKFVVICKFSYEWPKI